MEEFLKSKLVTIPDFPKPGILFYDIFSIFQDPLATTTLVDHIVDHVKSLNVPISAIAGLDSRGFLLGPWIANKLGIAFVPIRKAGKLPGDVYKTEYTKEYGSDGFEISKYALKRGDNVIVLDDLIAIFLLSLDSLSLL